MRQLPNCHEGGERLQSVDLDPANTAALGFDSSHEQSHYFGVSRDKTLAGVKIQIHAAAPAVQETIMFEGQTGRYLVSMLSDPYRPHR